MIQTIFRSYLMAMSRPVYADSVYENEQHDLWLSGRDIDNRIIKRAYRNKPLSKQDKGFNCLHSGERCAVERVFGVLGLHYGIDRARCYMGLARNRIRFELMSVPHNIKRGFAIQQAGFT